MIAINLDKEIELAQLRVAELKRQQREVQKAQQRETQPNARRGRPRTKREKLIKALNLAEKMSLSDAAMRAGVGLTTLYKYGIKRKVLEAKTR